MMSEAPLVNSLNGSRGERSLAETSGHPARGGHALRAFWWRQLRRWHWASSAICLVGMLGFAATGITLNHAARLSGESVTIRRETTLPWPMTARLAAMRVHAPSPLPPDVLRHIQTTLELDLEGRPAEWSEHDIYVPLPRPGGDAFVTIDRASGRTEYERTHRGWIAYANDLHKARHTGLAWAWFLDVFAVGCLVFCLTGLCLLCLHAKQRPFTWPAVAAGLAIPMLIGLWLIH